MMIHRTSPVKATSQIRSSVVRAAPRQEIASQTSKGLPVYPAQTGINLPIRKGCTLKRFMLTMAFLVLLTQSVSAWVCYFIHGDERGLGHSCNGHGIFNLWSQNCEYWRDYPDVQPNRKHDDCHVILCGSCNDSYEVYDHMYFKLHIEILKRKGHCQRLRTHYPHTMVECKAEYDGGVHDLLSWKKIWPVRARRKGTCSDTGPGAIPHSYTACVAGWDADKKAKSLQKVHFPNRGWKCTLKRRRRLNALQYVFDQVLPSESDDHKSQSKGDC